MWKTSEGSTSQLIQFCLGYFVLYTITGISVKYFTGNASLGFPGMNDIQYLVYNTIGGSLLALIVVISLKWYKLQSNALIHLGPFSFPSEFLYIIPSGVCTAVVIPTTTLMYTLPISVMVAMVIMRGSIIVISRLVDAVQIKQGILKKKVYREENIAVVFAILAVAANVIDVRGGSSFDFLGSAAAVTILSSYLVAYAFRIYIMNYYKNTRAKNVKQDNKGFFAIEQISASVTMIIVSIIIFYSTQLFGWNAIQITEFRDSFITPKSFWEWAFISGFAYGALAFFSVFIFMFKGRTATFAGLVNRLTSLVAGTSATLLFAVFFGGKFPKSEDWVTLAFIFIAVAFLTRAEKRRISELKALHEIDEVNNRELREEGVKSTAG